MGDEPGGIEVAVPKRKMGRARTRNRRAAAWKLKSQARSVCPQCGQAKLPHVVCKSCGTYRGRQVLVVE